MEYGKGIWQRDGPFPFFLGIGALLFHTWLAGGLLIGVALATGALLLRAMRSLKL